MKDASCVASNLKNSRKSSANGDSSIASLPTKLECRDPLRVAAIEPEVRVWIRSAELARAEDPRHAAGIASGIGLLLAPGHVPGLSEATVAPDTRNARRPGTAGVGRSRAGLAAVAVRR